MGETRTAVGIVGAGPAGLLLGHLLQQAGIDSVTVEIRSERHVIDRVRAGVLEQTSVDLLQDVGLGDRLSREGLRHEGLHIAFGGARHRLDLVSLTGGRAITVYGQNEIVRDLIGARRAAGGRVVFDAESVTLSDLTSDRPRIDLRTADGTESIVCDYIAGCDGFYGVCRASLSTSSIQTYDRAYPFAWLGILADAAPSSNELVYSLHERGFALFSMRTNNVTRLYLQCSPYDSIDNWSDDRIWNELHVRLKTDDGWEPNHGTILQKGITGMRSFMVEPMGSGRVFLAGDAAHIVPPTGAKGLNLALADVWRLARAFDAFYRRGSSTACDAYSDHGLRRAWRAQRFSYWMTSMLHRSDSSNPFDYRRQLADLDYLVSSRAAMTSLAENYVGWTLD